MGSLYSPPAVRFLQEIVDSVHSTSATCGFPVARPSSDIPSSFDADIHLPPPPSISSTLLAMGARPSLTNKLSSFYEDFALRLRDAAEVNLRRTIYTCVQINAQFGLSTYDPKPVHAAASNLHLRILREAADWILQLYRQKSKHSTIAIPRTISVAYVPRASPSSRPRASNQHTKVPLLPQSFAFSTVMPPLGLHAQAEFNKADGTVTKTSSDARSCWRAHIDRGASIPDDMRLGPHCSAWAYPAQYTHVDSRSSRALPSSSADFFPKARHTGRRNPSKETLSLTSSSLIEFGELRISNAEVRSERGNTKPTSHSKSAHPVFSPTPPGSVAAGSATRILWTASETAIHGGPISRSPSNRRRVAPIPRRGSKATAMSSAYASCSKSRSSGQPETPSSVAHPVAQVAAAQNAMPSVVDDVPNPLSLSVAHPRRRKMAPLPHRQPNNPARCHSPISALSIRKEQTPTHSMPARSSSCISRTPSLVSIASSRGESPSLSDDGPYTPKTSPSVQSFELPSPSPNHDSKSAPSASPPLSAGRVKLAPRVVDETTARQASFRFHGCNVLVKDEPLAEMSWSCYADTFNASSYDGLWSQG